MSSDGRRHFYMVGPDMNCNPSDFAFVNEAEALIDGRMAGTHEFPIEGQKAPISIGIPPLRKTPVLIVGVEDDQLLDIYGLGKRYVSTRAKLLLSSIDPEAFEFAECVTTDRTGKPIESYWMMDVIRMVERFDEDRSSVISYAERFPDIPNVAKNPYLFMLNDVYFKDLPEEYRAFYLLRFTTRFIFEETITKAWRSSGFIGAKFSPLQPPTQAEVGDNLGFDNYPYWTERGAKA